MVINYIEAFITRALLSYRYWIHTVNSLKRWILSTLNTIGGKFQIRLLQAVNFVQISLDWQSTLNHTPEGAVFYVMILILNHIDTFITRALAIA